MYPGGNAVNVAVHARRNGATSAYLGAVGTDRAGHVVLAALEEEGVDTTLTRRVDGPNAYADVRVVAATGCSAAADVGISRFTVGPDDLAAAAAFDIVHTGECSMLEEQLEGAGRGGTHPVLRLLRAALGLRADPRARRVGRHLVPARREPGRRGGPGAPPPRPAARRWSRSPWAPAVRCCCTRTSSPTAQSAPDRSWTPSGPETPSSPGSWSGIARSNRFEQLVGARHGLRHRRAAPRTAPSGTAHRSPARWPSPTPSATADWTSDEPCNTHEHLSGGGLRGADLRRLRRAVNQRAPARRPRRPT